MSWRTVEICDSCLKETSTTVKISILEGGGVIQELDVCEPCKEKVSIALSKIFPVIRKAREEWLARNKEKGTSCTQGETT
jgi:hypothetical protein